MPQTPDPHVIAFLKAPRSGEVKTRLATSIGKDAALGAYKRLVERQLDEVPENWSVELRFAPADSRSEFEAWLGTGYALLEQCDGDLGQRLSLAVEQHFARRPGPLFLIGGDCPGLDRSLLEVAAERLEAAQAVIGPAEDGGYYLLGLNSSHLALFSGISWGTDAVLEQTMKQAQLLGLSVLELPQRYDVDRREDWSRARADFPELIQ